MKVDVTSEEKPYQKRLEVEVPWEDVREEYEKSLREFRKDLELPGFRPGKVPVKVIKRQYGKQLEYQFASDALDTYYRQALDEIEDTPVNQGAIEDLEFAEGEPLRFSARFDTEPDLEIFDYKNGFEVEHTLYESTPADVDQALEELREQHAEVTEKDTGAEKGDLLLIDLQRVDESGNPIIGQKVEDREIKVGDGLFGGENMERLRGARKGDTRQIVVQPQDEGDEIEYYNVEVKNVEEQNLPELNNEFAEKVQGEAETYDGLREQIQKNIQNRLDQDANDQLSQRIAQKFVSQCDTELPDSMIENYLEMLMEDVKRRQASQSGSPPNIDEQVFKQNYRADAIYNLKWQLIKKQIIEREDLQVEEEELEARIQEVAESYPEENREAIQNLYRNEQYKGRLREDLLDRKVLEHIRSFADIKETTKTTTEVRQEAEAREAAESAVRKPQ
ncbi:MAG TPA: trigger factor [bacterium]|nr:trigger factor [bacterium]